MDPNYALYLSGILNQDDLEKSKGMETKNYMFFLI
jgi:hypothetical protein